MISRSPFAPKKNISNHYIRGLDFYTFNAGFKKYKKDLLIAVFDNLAQVAGVTTKNSLPAAPVTWTRKVLKKGKCKILIVNSGIANAFTGERAIKDIEKYAKHASKKFKCKQNEIYISSTGLIGEYLDYKKIIRAINTIEKKHESNLLESAKAIMTTDTYPKAVVKKIRYKKDKIEIFGISKGSGMISPNMATMLAYIFINVPIAKKILDGILKKSNELSFNSISVDGDMSTNDSVLFFSLYNKSIKKITSKRDKRFKIIEKSIILLMQDLAKKIVLDGEGISKFIEINIKNSKTINQARTIAKAISNSPLVKTAIAGSDPNWGRIIASIGSTTEKLNSNNIKLKFGRFIICDRGKVINKYNESKVKKYMKRNKIKINIDLRLGKYSKQFWTTDLNENYIKINKGYRT